MNHVVVNSNAKMKSSFRFEQHLRNLAGLIYVEIRVCCKQLHALLISISFCQDQIACFESDIWGTYKNCCQSHLQETEHAMHDPESL